MAQRVRASQHSGIQGGGVLLIVPLSIWGPINRAPINRGSINSVPIDRGPINSELINRGPIIRTPIYRGPINRASSNRGPINSAAINGGSVNRASINRAPMNKGKEGNQVTNLLKIFWGAIPKCRDLVALGPWGNPRF